MKCKRCKLGLTYFFFQIGGMRLCKSCASELMRDIEDFRVSLHDKETVK